MPSYKLMYFDARARGELIRLIFAAAGIPFTDDRISQEAFGQMKTKNPNQTLPILEVSGSGVEGKLTLNQSMAITRYLSRVFGLDGESLTDKGMVEEILENLVDVKLTLFSCLFNKTDENVEKLNKAVNKACTTIEGIIQANMKKGAGFAVGSKLTFADIFIYEAFESVLGINPKALDAFPGIKQCREKTQKLPKIAEYLKKRKDTPY